MNNNLGHFFNVQFKQLCTYCEDWTDDACDVCSQPVCINCECQDCEYDHYEDEEEQ